MLGPATNLTDASGRLSLQPLSDNSPDYVDLSAARGNNCLKKLEIRLRRFVENQETSCHVAFIGHRGSGKSTELLRMEEKLSDIFLPIHLYVDGRLQEDADYPELLLLLVESIAEAFAKKKISLAPEHAQAVADWFSQVTKFETEKTELASSLETGAEASAGVRVFGLGFKLFAKLRSAITGSKERRNEMRREVKKYADELIELVNAFLRAADSALQAQPKPLRLLLVQDNLDRLGRDAALNLFNENGETLNRLEVACVWTPPVGSLLSPFNISQKFQHFPMPMISVRRKNGKTNPDAIKGLTALVEKRLSIPDIFATAALVKELILVSGGSVRELLRFIDAALLNTRAEDHTHIEKSDTKAAIKEYALQLENSLVPSNIFLPILAEISVHKEFTADLEHGYSAEAVDARRHFFHSLIAQESVFAYNGDENWEDVHPALHVLPAFIKALAGVKPANP